MQLFCFPTLSENPACEVVRCAPGRSFRRNGVGPASIRAEDVDEIAIAFVSKARKAREPMLANPSYILAYRQQLNEKASLYRRLMNNWHTKISRRPEFQPLRTSVL